MEQDVAGCVTRHVDDVERGPTEIDALSVGKRMIDGRLRLDGITEGEALVLRALVQRRVIGMHPGGGTGSADERGDTLDVVEMRVRQQDRLTPEAFGSDEVGHRLRFRTRVNCDGGPA